jgi:LuxR family maltose regulon positive regulatory protein
VEMSLLTTKLNIPPAIPRTVPRLRLLERCQAVLGYKLALISAPAGFGKTTLLSEWARGQPPLGVAWLSLEEGENEPKRFWEYLIVALKTIRPEVGEDSMNLLRYLDPAPLESVLTPLINDLVKIPEDIFLVLDDYHFIHSQVVHDGLTFFLEHMPSRVHLVIGTRIDPPLPLARFRGKGTVLEIGTDDLRFTLEEATSLLTGSGVSVLSREEIEALNHRTEGWAAGLKMAMLSLSGKKDVSEFVSSFTGSYRYIMDYLIEEVLERQPPYVRDFLLRTSVLERLSGSLCDAVTGRTEGDRMLHDCENANLFIVPLDESREWYRYEHLFADLLRHRLDIELGKDTAAEMHRRASRWYEANGFEDDAIKHALAAADWKTAVRLLETASPLRVKRGEATSLLKWLQTLPVEVLRANPQLYILCVKLLPTTDRDNTAEAALKDLETIAGDDTGLQGKIAAMRMKIVQSSGDIEQATIYGQTALSLLPEKDLDERQYVCSFLGRVQLHRSNYTEAEKLLNESIEISQHTADYMGIAHSTAWLSTILHLKGNLHEAFELCRRTCDSMPKLPPVAFPLAYMGMINYEWNDLEAALACLKQAVGWSNATGPEAQEWILNQLARTFLATGDEDEAMQTLARIDKLVEDTGSIVMTFRSQTVSFHVETALRQGDLKTAMEWGDRLSNAPAESPVTLEARIRLLLAQGKKTEVAAYLKMGYGMIPPDLKTGLIAVRMFQAEAAESVDEGAAFLLDALTMAEPEGFVRIFVNQGMVLAPILRNLIASHTRPEYARKLLTAIEEEERRRKSKHREITPDSPPGLISERELEVLKLLAAGLSNQEIAEKLIISLNTTKTHLRHIFEKLEASGRTQAIARARELKLI